MSDLMTILASLQDQGVDTSAEMLLLRQREKAASDRDGMSLWTTPDFTA